MRTFYIFKINNEFTALTRNCPYNLFKSMEKIYYTDKKDLNVAYNVYEQIVLPFKKDKINVDIFENYKDNDHYTKFNNIHMINNFYNDEQTKLIVNSSHMILKTTVMAPSFFNILRNYSNIFVCDFENKDYFWLESVLV
ncbi:MAG TPA: sporulation inhibitor of replication protein SirA [Bacilli bacterium]|nr:sporulation inhibitor of replication protein SirA [Bacilli bacterium]